MSKELPSYVSHKQADVSDDPIGVRMECLKLACSVVQSDYGEDATIRYADKMLKFVVEAKVPPSP